VLGREEALSRTCRLLLVLLAASSPAWAEPLEDRALAPNTGQLSALSSLELKYPYNRYTYGLAADG
jgi:hypothetical protein